MLMSHNSPLYSISAIVINIDSACGVLVDNAHIYLSSCIDDNDEAAVFQRNFLNLAQGITNPGVFGADLYAASLITAELRDNAAENIHPSCRCVLQLLSAVEAQIKLYPAQNFPQFIKILCKEKYYLLAKSLCPKLGKCVHAYQISSKNCYHYYSWKVHSGT